MGMIDDVLRKSFDYVPKKSATIAVEELIKLRQERDDWKADAERLDDACQLIFDVLGVEFANTYPITTATIEMAREQHQETVEKWSGK